MDYYDVVKSAHGLIGTVALATFWLSGFSRKGGPVHRASGKIYLLAMTGMLLSGVPMAAAFYTRQHPVAAAFLAYLQPRLTSPEKAFSQLLTLRQFLTSQGIFAFFDSPWIAYRLTS